MGVTRLCGFATRHAALLFLTALGGIASATVLLGQTVNYTLYTPEGRRTLAVRAGEPADTLALDQLAATFGLTFTEDRLSNGLVIETRRQRIIAVPGQSFVQVAGRVVALDGPIRRERNNWVGPLDFLTKALGPAIGQPIVIRRTSRLVLVGNVRVPLVGGRVERTASGARIVLTVQPATPYRVTRDANRLTVRFDAAALDPTALTGFIPEFASAAKVDGSALVIELGPRAASFRADTGTDVVTIDLLPPAPVTPPPPPAPPAAPPLPQVDLAPGLRTIVIDPGHGGEDEGTKGTHGTLEKDLVLQLARRLKAGIEQRLGLRVLLTRDGDIDIPLDRRTELANHNKADLFISLHANSSGRPAARGAQVYSLEVSAYASRPPAPDQRRRTVPVLGGGTRVIDPMPWELAQIPFADQAAAFGALVIQQLGDHGVALHQRTAPTAPMRILAGANMPAILIEFGFLSNEEDERALGSGTTQTTMIEAIVAAIADVRRGLTQPGTTGGRR